MNKKFYIVVPAYKARKTLEDTINRIPQEIYSNVKEIVIIEDCNETDEKSASKSLLLKYDKCKVIHHKRQQGYGAAQKTGYNYCKKQNCDGVVLLHADGQYDPKYLNIFYQKLFIDNFDFVQASRMIVPGKAIEGGMPRWKYFLNKIVTFFENIIYQTNFSEFHSGYVGYSKKTLENVSYNKLSNTFHFDGEMLIMCKIKKLKFIDFPISSFYGENSSSLNPFEYGIQILKVIFRYIFGYYHRI